jgi:hypothetical protein
MMEAHNRFLAPRFSSVATVTEVEERAPQAPRKRVAFGLWLASLVVAAAAIAGGMGPLLGL